eukprot:EC095911.1.p1 GENE.EC095911.1~~EC095911.1.p1  ORF type:complete len:204 (+),score=4.62 EC095911.1:1-612(+)
MGQDFIFNNMVDNIDLASIHVWPDNWQRTDIEFQRQWISVHLEIANKVLKKPLLIEEFGKKLGSIEDQTRDKILALRDPVYAQTYMEVENGINGALAGTLFWQWHMPKFAGAGSSDYGVQPKDTTFQIILQHTKFINRHIHSAVSRKECQTECWVPNNRGQCVNTPEICNDANTQSLTYTSQRACCRKGSGAFDNGCWAYWFQ